MNDENITTSLVNREKFNEFNEIEKLFNDLFTQIEELKKENKLLKEKLGETERYLEKN